MENHNVPRSAGSFEGRDGDGRGVPAFSVVGGLLLVLMAATFWTWPLGVERDHAQEVGKQGPGWSVAFTQPERGTSEIGPVERMVIGAIDGAQRRIDLAVYSLNLRSIRDALLRASERGVQIRMVMETDNLDAPEVRELIGAGIPIRSDERDHLMHHKFMILDQQEAWIGSMNFTFPGARLENNNGMLIENDELAASLEVEFEEMFVDDRFGQLSLRDTPFQMTQLDGRVLEVMFAPDDLVTRRLVQIIRGAQEGIRILAFILTSDPITDALVQQAESGVPVEVVLEADNANAPGSDFLSLMESGVQVRLDSNPYNMHHKVLIADNRVVAMGSFNYTRSAQDFNDETLLLIHEPDVVSAYRAEFDRLFRAAIP